VLKLAGVAEDYFRHPPEMGRNVVGILKIAEVLKVNPAELMGLDLPNDERRSMTMIAHVMAHVHLTTMRANGNGNRRRGRHREDRPGGDGSAEAIRGRPGYAKTSAEGGSASKNTAIGVTTSSPSCQILPSHRMVVNSRRPATAARYGLARCTAAMSTCAIGTNDNARVSSRGMPDMLSCLLLGLFARLTVG
jgi:hypothetical protein